LANLVQKNVKGSKVTESDFGEDKDKGDYDVSYAKIQKLGYKSTISVEQGIRGMLKVFTYLLPDDLCMYKNI
jgi:nucleoside-diphosphate-sugar epimerase